MDRGHASNLVMQPLSAQGDEGVQDCVPDWTEDETLKTMQNVSCLETMTAETGERAGPCHCAQWQELIYRGLTRRYTVASHRARHNCKQALLKEKSSWN